MSMNHHQVVQKLFKEHFGQDPIIEGVEIGTFCGDLTRSILSELPNSVVHTIDPWLHQPGKEFEAGNFQDYHDKNEALARSKLEGFGDRVCIHKVTSEEASHFDTIPTELDFVWIDGDHSGDTVIQDIEMWYPRVAETGILGGHDFGQVHPLTEIIFRTFDRFLNSGNDFTWWVYAEDIKHLIKEGDVLQVH